MSQTFLWQSGICSIIVFIHVLSCPQLAESVSRTLHVLFQQRISVNERIESVKNLFTGEHWRRISQFISKLLLPYITMGFDVEKGNRNNIAQYGIARHQQFPKVKVSHFNKISCKPSGFQLCKNTYFLDLNLCPGKPFGPTGRTYFLLLIKETQ